MDPAPVKAALEELVNGLAVAQAAFGGRGVTFSQPFVELMKSRMTPGPALPHG